MSITAASVDIKTKNLKANVFSNYLCERKVSLTPTSVSTLQINITKMCNQACVHCHVDASPRRREMMSELVLDACLKILAENGEIGVLDITGGAPELHPRFIELVEKTRDLGKRVIVRHNLTVTHDLHPLLKTSMEYLPEFFAKQNVEIVSSLPYYQSYFTDKQRGDGVFEKSIKSLQILNKLGYGQPGSHKILNLVYNPAGAFLPAPQKGLENDFKKELFNKYGVVFNSLFALTNMPINRFKAQLIKSKGLEVYMEKLMQAFNPIAANGVMCRDMISVSYDGKLYDCDFNQMLNMPIENKAEKAMTIFDFSSSALLEREIKVDDHCFACTAGAGSSCGGNTVD
ncbi:MAG: arsenosugar biosynthesis radical SAM protein ArsS [Oligoflexales bacterium]|nr:arsenosugar biosynthesis radical SAM protein ArsS [Oligoflexales bacterium]